MLNNKSFFTQLNLALHWYLPQPEADEVREDYRDMRLMSMCRAMVVSNSSFCCLASLLNTEKQYVLNTSGWEV